MDEWLLQFFFRGDQTFHIIVGSAGDDEGADQGLLIIIMHINGARVQLA